MNAYAVIFMENLGIARQNAAWLGSAGAILGALGGILLLAITERPGRVGLPLPRSWACRWSF
uniref:hypothetical protein n=1 Tax=Altererythrobacter segetis TaxID=1104773 RepID=UPI003C2C4CD2